MADVNTSHISNIENNRVKISLSTLVHVCNALNVTVDSILSDEYNTPVSVLEHEILLEVQSFPLETQKQILKIIRALH
ncbi:MAG TPA: helix-turn-helix domain-containing protein [Candidatus Mediterraneibacter pullistercoris]|nr:helix-turn-helix domain-containing protein [Candidatus Mediterraneibacter pullistercoris]